MEPTIYYGLVSVGLERENSDYKKEQIHGVMLMGPEVLASDFMDGYSNRLIRLHEARDSNS